MSRTTYLHSGWQFLEAGWPTGNGEYVITPGWMEAQVPGHVHLDLIRHGVIAHPFSGMAELGCQWVDEKDWSYRTAFEWHPDPILTKRVLHFEGLDTICQIYLNDQPIAAHDNMFLPLEVDVSELLLAGANTLRIDFQSAVRIGNERRTAYFESEGLPLDTRCFNERAFVRKAQYMFGWDWGPRLVGCGIWRPVCLVESDPAERSEPYDPAPHRKVKLLREPDQFGESFEFEIDGKKTWIKGANWIPDHSFPALITKAQLRDRLEKAKDMGFNMLRVWGGGFYESEDFYDLCDELGLLVWQDFPFACSYYPDSDEWKSIIREEAEFHVRRLQRHPCLALWCGNNENETLHFDRWGGDKTPPRYYGESIYDEVLRDVVARLDPDTPYIPTSPIGNSPDGGPNSGGFGDQHCWDVWHGRGDWKYYSESTGRFSSEYGFASSCSLAVWDQVLDDWAADYPFQMEDPVLKWHDKTRKGTDTFVGFVRLHYPEPTTLADWVYYSQLNQRDAMRAGVEHYRRSAFCRGSLIWQLNDCWPVQSWSMLDSAGHYKAVAYEMRRLYADQLLSIERKNDLIQIHAVNDGEAVRGSVTLSAFNIQSGEMVRTLAQIEFALESDDRKVILEASLKGLSTPDTLVVAQWDGNTAWHLLAEPKHARFGDPKPLTISTAVDGALVIQTQQPLVDLMLSDDQDVALFEDNFITIPTHGAFQVRYRGDGASIRARSLAGWHEVRLTPSPLVKMQSESG